VAWELWDDGSGATSPKAFIDIEFVHESITIRAFEIRKEVVQEGFHLLLALVDAAARGLLGSDSSREFCELSRGGKDRLDSAAKNNLGRRAVCAVVCNCGGPVAIVLGDVADDDARRRPEVDHSVATIDAPEIFDELFAGVSVSECRERWRRRQLHTRLWRLRKRGNS